MLSNGSRGADVGHIATTVDHFCDAYGVHVLTLIRELCRVVQYQHEAIDLSKTVACRAKIPRQNVGFVAPLIGQKSICRFRIGPILADERNTAANRSRDTLQECQKASL
jgi:hypothetical protein